MADRREAIRLAVRDLAIDLLYRVTADLPPDAVREAVAAGEVGPDEMVAWFDQELRQRLGLAQWPRRWPTPWGYVEVDTNEATIASTVEDPPKARLCSTSGLGLGALSMGRLRPDGRQEEMVLIQGKQDEATRDLPAGDPRTFSGELTFHLRDGTPGAGDEGGMVSVLELTTRQIKAFGQVVATRGGA